MVDIGDAYLEVQDRLIRAVTGPGAETDAGVPACPGWTVHDVLAHHVGVVVGVASGDLGEFGALSDEIFEQWRDREIQRRRDALTARQVQERRLHDIAALVEEWRDATVEILPLLRGEAPVPATLPSFVAFILITMSLSMKPTSVLRSDSHGPRRLQHSRSPSPRTRSASRTGSAPSGSLASLLSMAERNAVLAKVRRQRRSRPIVTSSCACSLGAGLETRSSSSTGPAIPAPTLTSSPNTGLQPSSASTEHLSDLPVQVVRDCPRRARHPRMPDGGMREHVC
jgi:hypothetical protein